MLLRTHLPEIVQIGKHLVVIVAPLLKSVLPLMKKLLKPLAKKVLILLGLTAAASTANTYIEQKKTWFWTSF